MKYFTLEPNYISSSRFKDIVANSAKTSLINKKHFKVDDIKLLDFNILKNIKLDSLDFIVNHDVLEEICAENSIGIYIDKKDNDIDNVDWDFINRACFRLNKYLKKPVLYIFSNDDIECDLRIDFPFKILSELNWLENFYFLSKCRHSIILENSSYSINFWSALYENKSYSLRIIQKNKDRKYKPSNWIEV